MMSSWLDRTIDKTFSIYHIPNVKIGCSDDVERRVSAQGYSDYEILESHSCIFTASDREKKLQQEYGYPVDKILYWQSFKRLGSKPGKLGGKNAQKTLREQKKGFYTDDKKIKSYRGKLGGNAILEKYGKDHYKQMRANSNCVEKSKEVCNKSILQFTTDNIFVKKFTSITEASDYFNVSHAAISNCLRGITKKSAGYIWKYDE